MSILLFLFLNLSSFAEPKPSPGLAVMHELVPDATGEEYLRQIMRIRAMGGDVGDSGPLAEILQAGERNYEWLALINSKRPANDQLSFTSASTRHGYPIDAPLEYSPKLIRDSFDSFSAIGPKEFVNVVLGRQPMSTDLPIPKEQYLLWGRRLDQDYQMAARWQLLLPYLGELERRQAWDVRGYYQLERLSNRDEKIRNFSNLPRLEREQIANWLVGICRNSSSSSEWCARQLNREIAGGNDGAEIFFHTYWARAKDTFESFFKISSEARRNDIAWTNQNLATIPFLDPGSASVRTFLGNIEDEWAWHGWNLKLDYQSKRADIPHVIFVPGVTPHVDRLGGNEITMDANVSLTDWEAGWIVRHEFGHVLGFPDCYVEFYDRARESVFVYQIDILNLMCSRMGNLQEKHYLEMKRTYAR